MTDLFNPFLDNRRVWECARNHGVIMIIGLEDDLYQECPLCNARLSKSRHIFLVSVLACPSPFQSRRIM